MNAQKLALLNTARMSCLARIRQFADTPIEEHFQSALRAINHSAKHLRDGQEVFAHIAMKGAELHLERAREAFLAQVQA
jgi:hypothetical protein